MFETIVSATDGSEHADREGRGLPYASIRTVSRLPIRIRRWRLWGSGDLRLHRPGKTVALELDTGHVERLTAARSS